MGKITRILHAIDEGDSQAAEQLLPLVYDELRLLAAQRLAREPSGQTLQPTALVHEAYLRLVGNGDRPVWRSMGHFFGAAAEAMRRILIDNARKKLRPKHGGDRRRVDLSKVSPWTDNTPDALVAVDDVLKKLETEFPERAQLVKLRRYGGCTIEQAAAALRISPATAKRHWAFARAFLYSELSDRS